MENNSVLPESHKVKQKIRVTAVIIAVVLTAGVAGLLAGCTKVQGKAGLSNSVNLDGTDYILQPNIQINFDGFDNLSEGLSELCEKVGTVGNADIYRIRDLGQDDWIFVDNNSMLSSNAPYGGVYLSSAVRMDTVADFKPDYIDIYYLTPPTSEQSGAGIRIVSLDDSEIIGKIASAIDNGKPVSSEKQAEVTKAMINGTNGFWTCRLEFLSESYPNLVYRLEYIESVNREFYVGCYDEKNSYKIIEIDNTLHECLLSLPVE